MPETKYIRRGAHLDTRGVRTSKPRSGRYPKEASGCSMARKAAHAQKIEDSTESHYKPLTPEEYLAKRREEEARELANFRRVKEEYEMEELQQRIKAANERKAKSNVGAVESSGDTACH